MTTCSNYGPKYPLFCLIISPLTLCFLAFCPSQRFIACCFTSTQDCASEQPNSCPQESKNLSTIPTRDSLSLKYGSLMSSGFISSSRGVLSWQVQHLPPAPHSFNGLSANLSAWAQILQGTVGGGGSGFCCSKHSSSSRI